MIAGERVIGMHADQEYSYTEQVAKLKLPDFDRLFTDNGLCLQHIYGDYDLNDYDRKRSPRLIMTAKKR